MLPGFSQAASVDIVAYLSQGSDNRAAESADAFVRLGVIPADGDWLLLQGEGTFGALGLMGSA